MRFLVKERNMPYLVLLLLAKKTPTSGSPGMGDQVRKHVYTGVQYAYNCVQTLN